MDARMSTTSEDLYEIARLAKEEGASLAIMVRRLVDAGATEVDLVRVVKRIENVSFGQAAEFLRVVGASSSQSKGITIVVPDGHTWDDWVRSLESSGDNELSAPGSSRWPE
jgi:hypothetical protein